jgi:catechol 2,3-dioxygenase-like lactoylglutathione lyase family enzyme
MKIVLLVSDVARSRRFYAGLGFHVVERGADATTVALGDAVLELQSDEAARRGPDYFTPEIDRFPRGTGVEIVVATGDRAVVDAAATAAADADEDVISSGSDGAQGDLRVADPDGYLIRLTA